MGDVRKGVAVDGDDERVRRGANVFDLLKGAKSRGFVSTDMRRSEREGGSALRDKALWVTGLVPRSTRIRHPYRWEVGGGEIRIDPNKVAVLEAWPVVELKTQEDAQVAMGLMNYIRPVIKGYAEMARPVTSHEALVTSHLVMREVSSDCSLR